MYELEMESITPIELSDWLFLYFEEAEGGVQGYWMTHIIYQKDRETAIREFSEYKNSWSSKISKVQIKELKK